MARPRVEVLDRDEVVEIHQTSIRILSRVGVKIDNVEVLNILKNGGAEVDFEKKIAKIPEHLVEEALKKKLSTVKLYYRDGKRFIELSRWGTYFVVGSTALYYIDWRSNEVRKALTKDLVEVARVADALNNIHMVSTALVPSDVPEVFVDIWRMYVVVKNCSKPIDTGVFTVEGVYNAYKLMSSILGEENVSKKPFMIFAVCPSPPLMWSYITIQNLVDCAKLGIPIHIIPMPQTGATAPATLAGSIAQGNAEFLSGLVISQLIKPGTPVIYGNSPVVFDQRYGTACVGSIEVMLMAAAFAQLARFYDIPSSSYVMVSDSKVVDPQTTLESALGALTAALTGINMAIGAGMLLEENGISLVKLVIDDDIAGEVMRFAKGIQVDPETLAEKIIEEIGSGGTYLKHRHTRNWWRKEHYLPKLLDKKTLEMWRRTGSKDLTTVAREYIEKTLKEHTIEPLPPDIEKNLDKTIQEIAKKHGIEKLPLTTSTTP
jgi:trimethylamine--corrinoid protein Co-methyltransferase